MIVNIKWNSWKMKIVAFSSWTLTMWCTQLQHAESETLQHWHDTFSSGKSLFELLRWIAKMKIIKFTSRSDANFSILRQANISRNYQRNSNSRCFALKFLKTSIDFCLNSWLHDRFCCNIFCWWWKSYPPALPYTRHGIIQQTREKNMHRCFTATWQLWIKIFIRL